jgi:tRNA-splicing ligase RtcB
MAQEKLRGKDLIKIGYPQGKVIGLAINAAGANLRKEGKTAQLKALKAVLAAPESFLQDPIFGQVAAALIVPKTVKNEQIELRPKRGDYRIYGASHIEQGALNQMDTAMRLPVSVGGALMPDAHQGYGLPIGGVLATENAIIPYAVGVDI